MWRGSACTCRTSSCSCLAPRFPSDTHLGNPMRSPCRRMAEIGYDMVHQEIRSAHYGVPQRRLRVWFLGVDRAAFGLTPQDAKEFSMEKSTKCLVKVFGLRLRTLGGLRGFLLGYVVRVVWLHAAFLWVSSSVVNLKLAVRFARPAGPACPTRPGPSDPPDPPRRTRPVPPDPSGPAGGFRNTIMLFQYECVNLYFCVFKERRPDQSSSNIGPKHGCSACCSPLCKQRKPLHKPEIDSDPC